jgi:hypothetical protein
VTVRLQLSVAPRRMSSGAETAGVLIDAVGEELRLALAELRERAGAGRCPS